jgi:hypothetical protein
MPGSRGKDSMLLRGYLKGLPISGIRIISTTINSFMEYVYRFMNVPGPGDNQDIDDLYGKELEKGLRNHREPDLE